MKENIFLTGFSGTGKTTIGKLLAERLGYDFVDTDDFVENIAGRSVPEIFASDGEAAFRELESAALVEICKHDLQVVATGGGIVLAKANRVEMTASGYVVCLEARPETIYVRLLLDQSGPVRPLLQGGDPFANVLNMKEARAPLYAESDWTVHTDFLTPEEAVDAIEGSLDLFRRRGVGAKGGAGSPATPGAPHSSLPIPMPVETARPAATGPLVVQTSIASYPIIFGSGERVRLGQYMKEHLPETVGGQVFIVSDEHVARLHGSATRDILRQAGYKVSLKTVPAGEESKSLAQVSELYDWLADQKAERRSVVVALGGGVVGDLAGYAAASWLRGLNFVQVPTSLLAMVDSSVGGKTGVNHRAGKNLIGAFYPPRLVLADIALLETLPDRERRSGWAEVVKHAVIPGADADDRGAAARFGRLETHCDRLAAGEPVITAQILRESVAVKAAVVAQDERETGLRITLNYGHTYAHALEKAVGYGTLLHGEAVAIGMHGVAKLSERFGLCDAAFVERQRRLLERFGLPLSVQGDTSTIERALIALGLDKKSEGGAVRWIIPRGIGRLEIRRDIPPALVREVLETLVTA